MVIYAYCSRSHFKVIERWRTYHLQQGLPWWWALVFVVLSCWILRLSFDRLKSPVLRSLHAQPPFLITIGFSCRWILHPSPCLPLSRSSCVVLPSPFTGCDVKGGRGVFFLSLTSYHCVLTALGPPGRGAEEEESGESCSAGCLFRRPCLVYVFHHYADSLAACPYSYKVSSPTILTANKYAFPFLGPLISPRPDFKALQWTL